MKRSKRSAVTGSNDRRLRRAGACVAALLLWPLATGAEEIHVDSSILTVIEAVQAPAPEAGLLRELAIREGSSVQAGDRLAEVDSREQRLTVEAIRQDLEVGRRESESDVAVRLAAKENKVAEAELARATTVNADIPNTVSAKEVDRLRLAFERTELEMEHAGFQRELLAARLKRIQADLDLAKHRVERLQITAPITGVVAELYRHAGEWVDAGEPIARIVRVDRLRVEGYIGIEEALQGLVNRSVEVTATLPSGGAITARGRVVFVSPEVEPVDAKVRFWAEVDNRAMRLRPGLTASVVILDSNADVRSAKRSAAP